MTIMETISKEQVKFAKTVTGESTESIAIKAGMGVATLQRFEAGKTELKPSSLAKLRSAVDSLLHEKKWRLTDTGGIDRIPADEPKPVEN